mmetsp:Transcript_18270/g.46411  ORF Transcript_18270/g.46411 Transcript_18270/m.46411 type:complete len:256 (+) Transcript_18270:332-1099(+)
MKLIQKYACGPGCDDARYVASHIADSKHNPCVPGRNIQMIDTHTSQCECVETESDHQIHHGLDCFGSTIAEHDEHDARSNHACDLEDAANRHHRPTETFLHGVSRNTHGQANQTLHQIGKSQQVGEVVDLYTQFLLVVGGRPIEENIEAPTVEELVEYDRPNARLGKYERPRNVGTAQLGEDTWWRRRRCRERGGGGGGRQWGASQSGRTGSQMSARTGPLRVCVQHTSCTLAFIRRGQRSAHQVCAVLRESQRA